MPDKSKSETVGVMSTVIRKDGIFDLDTLYNAIKGWFDQNKYEPTEYDMTRKFAPDGGEYNIKWRAKKNVDYYVRFEIKIEMWMWKAIEVLIERQNQRFKRFKASMEMKIDCVLVKNYNKTFPPTKFGNFLRRAAERYLWKKKLESDMEGKLYEEFEELQDKIKETLEQLT
ncbi:MAG: hypothetical protein AABW87_01615 [Nanoarchaeota archaeon]